MATSHLFQVSILVLLSSQAMFIRAVPFPDWKSDGPSTERPSPATYEPGKAYSNLMDSPTSQPSQSTDSFLLAMEEDIELGSLSNTRVQKLSNNASKGIAPGHYFSGFSGGSLNEKTGEFSPTSANTAGLFLFIAHIQLQRDSGSEAQEVSVALCINSDSNEALVTHGVLSGSTTTISVVGNLQLHASDTLTVKVTNKSNLGVTILKSSTFSAHRLR